MTGVLVLLATLVVASGIGFVLRRRAGRSRAVVSGEQVTPAEIGADLGERATLLQFSSAFCQPCRATRQVLGRVAGIVRQPDRLRERAARHSAVRLGCR